MILLKQSTAVVINLGPFVDFQDGVTLETGLVSALDHASTGIMLSKNGGTLAVRHASVTASTYDAHGCYKVTLDTTDTDTLGILRVIYTDATTCLPVWRDFTVVPAVVYDALVAGSDKLNVNMAEISDDATAADNLETMLDGTGGQTLSLKSLVVSNSAGSAVSFTSTGSNGNGIVITGHGSGSGVSIVGGSSSGLGIGVTTTNGHGISSVAGGTEKHALHLEANGTDATGLYATGAGGAAYFEGIFLVNEFQNDGTTTLQQAVSLGGALSIAGTTTLAAVNTGAISATTVATSGTVTLDALTITNNLLVSGNSTVTGTTTHTGNVSMEAGLTITQSATNGNAVTLTGNGTGSGLRVVSGSTGSAAVFLSIAAGTAGLVLTSNSASGASLSCPRTVSLASTFSVSGATTLDSLTVTNGTTFSGAVAATNASNDIRGITVTGTIGTFDALNTSLSGTHGAGSWATATGFSTLTQADIRTAVGLSSANLDTQLTAIDDYLDTEVAAIKAKTDNLPASPAAVGSAMTLASNSITAAVIASDAGTEIASAVDSTLTAQHGAGAWTGSGGSGSGAHPMTVTVTDGSAPLQNATVRIIDGGGIAVTGTTDASGNADFSLDNGTYTVAITKGGYSFTPITRTVTGDHLGTLESADLEMTQIVVVAPSDPLLCRVYGYFIGQDGQPMANAKVVIERKPHDRATAQSILATYKVEEFTDANGYLEADVIRTDAMTPSGFRYDITCDAAKVHLKRITLTSSTKDLATLL